MNNFDTRYGGPYDRGAADSYYGRPKDPHYFIGATYSSERVDSHLMTTEELLAYYAGYSENERLGNHKDWS